jgi:hypothetical protein
MWVFLLGALQVAAICLMLMTMKLKSSRKYLPLACLGKVMD